MWWRHFLGRKSAFLIIHQNKCHVFNHYHKPNKIDTFLTDFLSFKIWSFYLNLISPWVNCQNEWQDQNSRIKWPERYVTHGARGTFSYTNLIWPELTLNLCLAWAVYLCGIFGILSVALRQSLDLQRSLVWSRQPIRREEPAVTLNMTLTGHLTLSKF